MTVHELTQILGELNKPSKPEITEAILFLQSLQPDPLELADIVLNLPESELRKWQARNASLGLAVRLDRQIALLRSRKSEIEAEICKLAEERKAVSI